MEENKRYQQAEDYFFSEKQEVPSGEKPRLVFVFGSPGAGKSTSIKPLLMDSFQTSPVCLEVDELKAFLPENDANNTQTADKWFNDIVKKAVESRRNLVIFRLRNMLLPGQTQEILRNARQHGYTTEIDFLALDRRRSTLGMVHRYELALENYNKAEEKDIVNYPRRPEFDKHYIFFRALPIIAKMSEQSELVDKVNVYDRKGNLLAWQNKITGQASEISPLRAIRQERNRRWNFDERVRYESQRQAALEKMKHRQAGIKEILLAKILTSQLGK